MDRLEEENNQNIDSDFSKNPISDHDLLMHISERLANIEANIFSSSKHREKFFEVIELINSTSISNANMINVNLDNIRAVSQKLDLLSTTETANYQFTEIIKAINTLITTVETNESRHTETLLAVTQLMSQSKYDLEQVREGITRQLLEHKTVLERFITDLQSKSDKYLETKYEANTAVQNADGILKGMLDTVAAVTSCVEAMDKSCSTYNSTFDNLVKSMTEIVSALSKPSHALIWTEVAENVSTVIANLKPDRRTI